MPAQLCKKLCIITDNVKFKNVLRDASNENNKNLLKAIKSAVLDDVVKFINLKLVKTLITRIINMSHRLHQNSRSWTGVLVYTLYVYEYVDMMKNNWRLVPSVICTNTLQYSVTFKKCRLRDACLIWSVTV